MALFEKDFIMRQVQYLTQILQEIIFKKNQNQHEEAVEEIQDAFKRLTKNRPKQFSELNLEETLNLFVRNNKFESELATAVADLLMEEGQMLEEKSYTQSQKSYAQALLLYKNSLWDDTASVPLDISQKIDQLENMLKYANYIEEINNTLAAN